MGTVYIDLYFLVNVCMDLLCILIAGALMHREVGKWRGLLAALIGGAYAVAALLLGLSGFLGVLFDALAVMGMSALVFWKKGFSGWIIPRGGVVLWLISALMGGVMTALYAWLNRLNLPLEALEGDGLSVWIFATVTALAGLITVYGGKWFGLSKKIKAATVEARLFDKTVTLHAMVDTGNQLRDPISGKGVIVAELSVLAPLLPPDLLAACRSGDVSAWLTDPSRAKRIRLIPATTATGKGLLPALVPDALYILQEKNRIPANYLIAPKELRLDGFDAILPPD